MTQLIQRLEQHGLVERVRDPADGRAWLVEITDAGRHAMDERRAARDAWLAGLVAELSEEEQDALASALQAAAPILRKMVRGTESHPVSRGSAAPVREAGRGNKGIPDGYRTIDTAGR
jgi:DNA-binding PadR family transcriptional regulator